MLLRQGWHPPWPCQGSKHQSTVSSRECQGASATSWDGTVFVSICATPCWPHCNRSRPDKEGQRMAVDQLPPESLQGPKGQDREGHIPDILRHFEANCHPGWRFHEGLGAALLQDGKPVAFASKALTPTEREVCQHWALAVSCHVRMHTVPHLCLWLQIHRWDWTTRP